MAQSSDVVGEKTRPRVLERARRSNERSAQERRQIPPSYLARHRCKVCDGKHCTGHCKF
jgi:hypothetical protein